MTPTKLLIGQIVIVFAIMLLGVWAATQWAVWMRPHDGSQRLLEARAESLDVLSDYGRN